MPRCASVKNQASTDQCSAEALLGYSLCGRHNKCKTPRLWADVHREKTAQLVKVQALFRGWCVRKVLRWAGPGVLRRAQCVNDEDLTTCESKHRQDPMCYFGIEEAGKVWWFDFGTAWEWTIRSVTPQNPYTKVPFAHADLARLRKLHLYRRRHRLPVPTPSRDVAENIVRKWTVLTHIFRSFGFDDTHPEQFANLDHRNLNAMFLIFMDDLEAMPNPNRRLLTICRKGAERQFFTDSGYMISSLNLLTIALTDCQAYDAIFLLLSALYRC